MAKPARRLWIAAALLAFVVVFAVLIHTTLKDNTLGADYYTFWLAGNATAQHQNPYSSDVTSQSQLGIYKRLATSAEDQVAFAYPPYSLAILAPLIPLSFDWSYSGWLSLNLVAVFTLLFVLFQRAPKWLAPTVLLLYPVFFCLVLGNFSVMMGLVVLVFFGLIALGKDTSAATQVFAAILAAWATSKPQFMWLFILFMLLYALRFKLRPFLITFFAALLVFWGISFLLVPTWLPDWLHRVQAYAGYTRVRPVLTGMLILFLPEPMALGITAAGFAAGLAFTTRLFYQWWKGKASWLGVLAWAGTMTYLFHLHGISYEQVTFLAPLMLWVGQQKNWRSWPVLVFWFGSIILSWVVFAIGIAAIEQMPVLLSCAWTAWLLQPRAGSFQV